MTKTKVGDTRIMGGVELVAVEKEGRIAWEPVGGIDSVRLPAHSISSCTRGLHTHLTYVGRKS